MSTRPPWFRIGGLDRRLLATPRWAITLIVIATWLVMIAQAIPNVPREYIDLSPVFGNVQRYETYGPDTVADVYAARVISADVTDMYTKDDTAQTAV